MSQWPMTSIGSICRIVGGGTPSKQNSAYFQGEIPWATVKDFTGGVIMDTVDHITENAISNSAANLVPAGTVLVVTRVGLGKVAITGKALAINQDVKALFPNDSIVTDYLYWSLVSKAPEIERMGVGATVKGITLDHLKSLSIPLPPLDEQRRIVDILKRADSIRRLRKQALETTRELIPALFVDMFGDPATNPKGWEVKVLSEVADIGSGVTKGRKLNGHETVELPYLSVANVQDGYLNLTNIKSIHVKPAEIDRLRLQSGDLLMTEGGDPDKLGRCALWSGEVSPCLHQNHVFRVRCNRAVVLPEYVRALAGGGYGKRYFLQVAKQTTGIASINKTQLSAFPVLVPPLDRQKEFEGKCSDVRALIAQQENHLAQAEALKQSLMAQFFS